MTKEKQFLTSVADVLLIDDVTDTVILNGKTLISSAMSQAIQNTAVNGGKGSQKLFEFASQKELNFNIEDAAFSETYISIQNNAPINRILNDYYTNEYVTLNAQGKATLSQTPVGRVQVEGSNGVYMPVTPVGKDITVSGYANEEVLVVYAYKKMMDTIEIKADSFPRAIRLVLNADIYTANGKEKELQIIVPHFKPNGSLELSMTHDGVSTSSLEGTSLVDNKGNYAYITFNEISSTSVDLIGIMVTTDEVALEASVSNDSEALTVMGVRGGIYSNIILNNSDLTFTSATPAVATVNASGVVTKANAATVGQTTTITVTDGTFTDTIKVVIE